MWYVYEYVVWVGYVCELCDRVCVNCVVGVCEGVHVYGDMHVKYYACVAVVMYMYYCM